jgi:hypothetical protein
MTQVSPVEHVLPGPQDESAEQSTVPETQIPLPSAFDAQMQSMLEEQGVGNPESQVSPRQPCGDPNAA